MKRNFLSLKREGRNAFLELSSSGSECCCKHLMEFAANGWQEEENQCWPSAGITVVLFPVAFRGKWSKAEQDKMRKHFLGHAVVLGTHLLREQDYSWSRWSLLQSPLRGLISFFPAVFSLSGQTLKISGVDTYCQYVQLLFGSLNIAYLMISVSLNTGKVSGTAYLHAWIPSSLQTCACALHTQALAKPTFNQCKVNLHRILKIHFFQYFFSFWRRNQLADNCTNGKGPECVLPLLTSFY